MSNTDPLLTVSGPAIVLLESDVSSADRASCAWDDAGLTVRVVRGRKMRTVDSMFDEVAAALQFPWYFGENWPAFSECLSAMYWLRVEGGIAILILDAIEVLTDDVPVEMEVF